MVRISVERMGSGTLDAATASQLAPGEPRAKKRRPCPVYIFEEGYMLQYVDVKFVRCRLMSGKGLNGTTFILTFENGDGQQFDGWADPPVNSKILELQQEHEGKDIWLKLYFEAFPGSPPKNYMPFPVGDVKNIKFLDATAPGVKLLHT